MRFKEGDKAEFVYGGKLTKGVVTEIKASPFGISYLMTFDENNKTIWVAEDLLLSPAPVLKVPRFADDWISHCKQREYDLACLLDYEDSDMSAEMNDWLSSEDSNQELLMRAWLDGYEVEKEPLYWVQLIEGASGYLNVRNDGIQFINSSGQTAELKTRFTEKEIKAMDKGGAYWQFAVPVEDLEGEA
ncbi:TPA_asm: DUF1642 domain-containing protein [Listeria monocytogenes]|nr:DUF1642 domain-containing protein [Listeria monocytogenes]HAB9965812.1 DUF1642 domain-containing protein [Listeria monocytogenes]HAB9969313.1 DUF1642 domain-containing protein [Listeria monocytogenes]HAB9975223.1 DUF1642 domain-containing protein [Listeria monocytogenes]HAC0127529.1 DUF1642 domain-containing protein [Listeria monocytogenes]